MWYFRYQRAHSLRFNPSFVEQFLSSIYVDDGSFGSSDVESTYEFYLKSKSCLAEAGFRLKNLLPTPKSCVIKSAPMSNHQMSRKYCLMPAPRRKTSRYAKSSLGDRVEDTRGTHKILGVQWDFIQGSLVFDIRGISHLILNSEPTKRNVVSMATRFFNRLGVVSPITILFNIFFQNFVKPE